MSGIRIERAQNGYEVEVCDPAIEEKNAKSKGPWMDPYKCYVFTDKDQAISFVSKIMDTLQPEDTETEFDAAYKEATGD